MESPTTLFEIPDQLISQLKDNLYTTTAAGYNEIQKRYKQFPLPNDILFPWLHGVDGKSNQQCLFFGIRRCLTPNYRGIMVLHCDSLENVSRLIDTVLPNEIINEDDVFIHAVHNESSINLRSFSSQVSRFATLCDIVVYGRHAKEVATRVANAQNKLNAMKMKENEHTMKFTVKREMAKMNHLKYRTIIIQDDFTVFEQKYPDLVMYDSAGKSIHRLDLNELENIQMREMSVATEITENVWIGSTHEAPLLPQGISTDSRPNPHQFTICIECHDSADMPSPSLLTITRETLNPIDIQQPVEIIHFDIYSNGTFANKLESDEFFLRLQNLLVFMDAQVKKGRKILIHCLDGYTENSLLALTWIMYHLRLRLPLAYLHLQKTRSFFVYATDVPVLKRIESLFFDESVDSEPEAKRRKSTQYDAGSIHTTLRNTMEEDIYMDDISTSDDSACSTMATTGKQRISTGIPKTNHTSHLVNHGDKVSNTNESLFSGDIKPTNEIVHKIPVHIYNHPEQELKSHPWFYSPSFEGSFPSRILPFLYLGNLNHATNPDMLSILNITHIVSVGENADIDTNRFKVLYLDKLYDDGIHSIQDRLSTVYEFIEEAHANKTQCLIHCRVGVSRSAAITICYLMKYLNYTLIQAYIYVRARRLNVIIQPNLKFMYEMLQEEQRKLGSTTLTWPILCKEISILNSCYGDG
ncbi:hypothetical protein BDB01DRAFT_769965 [Pilobolus umbonatus]|nr:hypothetical protein BDB01DRAFT_769965 [Pilobolus umbonatus]